MPVIVVGADTPVGEHIVEALLEPGREIRAFVTSIPSAERLRSLGVKVALGDVSDSSHVEGACMNCFSAVLVTEAATDDRERSFANRPQAVLEGWSGAIRNVQRVIWVSNDPVPPTRVTETAVVASIDSDHRLVADRVASLDGLDSDHFLRAVAGC